MPPESERLAFSLCCWLLPLYTQMAVPYLALEDGKGQREGPQEISIAVSTGCSQKVGGKNGFNVHRNPFLFCMCMSVHMWVLAEARVTGSCELPYVDAGN